MLGIRKGEGLQADWMTADMFDVFWADTEEDGSFASLIKEDIDKDKFERMSQFAILYTKYKKGEGVKPILAGMGG